MPARLSTVADLARTAVLAAIPVSAAFSVLSLGELYMIAFLAGSASVLFMVSYSTLFVSLVPTESYVGATSLLNGSRAFSFVAGPSVGGVLVQLVTAPVAVAVDAASFVVSALFLGRIAPAEPPHEEAQRGLLLDGARFIVRSPLVRAALGATATINLFNFAFFALFFLYATRVLHVAPATLGFVLGAGAVGGILGSLITGRIARRIGIGRTFVLGCLLFPAPLVLVPLAGGPRTLILLALFAAEFGTGLGVMILDLSFGSIFAAAIPDRLRARVSGAYMFVNYGVRPIGAVAAGVLATSIGIRPTLWIATVGGLLGIVWLLPSPLPGLRELPGPPEGESA